MDARRSSNRGAAVHSHRPQRARTLPVPRRAATVRHQPRRRQRQRTQRRPRRRSSRGTSPAGVFLTWATHRRWHPVMVLGALRQRRLRAVHRRRCHDEEDSGRQRLAWTEHLAATRTLLAGTHRYHSLTQGPASSGRSGVNDGRMDSPAEPAEGGVRVVWAPDVWSFLVAGDDVASGTTPQGYLASV
jgi:hypothetical protein